MSEKLDKLRASLEKERERRIKINTRIESLERRIQEAEAAEVNEMVRTAKVTPEQLAALLRQSATATPNPAALSAVGATFNKEDDSNGERRPMNAICDTTAKSETLSVKGCKVKITYAPADTDCLDAIQKLLQTTILRTAGHTAA